MRGKRGLERASSGKEQGERENKHLLATFFLFASPAPFRRGELASEASLPPFALTAGKGEMLAVYTLITKISWTAILLLLHNLTRAILRLSALQQNRQGFWGRPGRGRERERESLGRGREDEVNEGYLEIYHGVVISSRD